MRMIKHDAEKERIVIEEALWTANRRRNDTRRRIWYCDTTLVSISLSLLL